MPFSSLLFLSAFLPLFLLAYYVAPKRAGNLVALAFSLLFYAWGAPKFILVVLALGVADFSLSHAIARQVHAGRKKALLVAGICVHLSALAYFKYSNFFVQEINELLAHVAPGARLGWTDVVLPIGISFITFEEISYLTDVYRGVARPARNWLTYLLFLMLFPHSIAGPIFRWRDLELQLDDRPRSFTLLGEGMVRFCRGLAKKVLVADAVAVIVDHVYELDPRTLNAQLAWLAALAYTLQIYFDFSGYSDMAIGLGRMAGFQFKENFDAPYTSESVSEFWKRWHMSLSRWLQDYLYVPLGGNRQGEWRTRFNLMTTFVLSGFWHGAAGTFIVWGAYHGIWVVIERSPAMRAVRARLPRLANVASTFLIALVGWVFFRAASMAQCFQILGAMAGLGEADLSRAPAMGWMVPTRSIVFLCVGCLIVALPSFIGRDRVKALVDRFSTPAAPFLLFASIMTLTNAKFVPLIYFKF